jgi:lipopolysaccharide/colanic/teichoic acid biosynthesis glycosyltransferase
MAILDQSLADRWSGNVPARFNSPKMRSSAGPGIYCNGLKRVLDVIFVIVTLPFWLPAILTTAAVVALDGHNPFYTQLRVGRHGRDFRMIKLRSMFHDADTVLETYLSSNPAARAEWNVTQKLKHDPRVTRIGRFIRKTSIDELPQLFNVLVGDMSLVGPRPMMVNQKPLYPGRSYYKVRPGLTGFWQISNRNHCHFAGRARYDNAYFNAMSLPTDLAVIWRTVGVVLRGTGY